MDGGLTAETLDEYIDSLEAFRIASPPVRFYAEWVATRSLIHNGYLDLADQRIAQLATLAAELDSARATRYLNELRGSITRTAS